jgi:hypothetical protein
MSEVKTSIKPVEMADSEVSVEVMKMVNDNFLLKGLPPMFGAKSIARSVSKIPSINLILSKESTGFLEEFTSWSELEMNCQGSDICDLAWKDWNELDMPIKSKCDYWRFKDYFFNDLEHYIEASGYKLERVKS